MPKAMMWRGMIFVGKTGEDNVWEDHYDIFPRIARVLATNGVTREAVYDKMTEDANAEPPLLTFGFLSTSTGRYEDLNRSYLSTEE